MLTPTPADAQSRRKAREPEPQIVNPQGPLTILVSLREQRLRVYDDNSLLATARVSSGKESTPTPTGIFTILQKNREHYSNLHNDAPMPNMQRITWSGIALHAGDLPGYAASHGCIRLPYRFSERLFAATTLGTRVIVTDAPVAPQSFTHPRLFSALPQSFAAASPSTPTMAHAEARGLRPSPAGGELVRTAGLAAPLLPIDTGSAPRTLDDARAERRATVEARAAVIPPYAAKLAGAGATLAAANLELRNSRSALKGERLALVKAAKLHAAAARASRDAARRLAAFSRAFAKEKSRIEAHSARRLAAQLAETVSDKPVAFLMDRAAERALAAGRERTAIDKSTVIELSLKAKSDELAAKEQQLASVLASRKKAVDERESALKATTRSIPQLEAALAGAKAALAEVTAAHTRAVTALNNFDMPATVLISRKARTIYIRQGHVEIYQGPAEFALPSIPVGTHMFTALRASDASATEFEWRLLTVAHGSVIGEPRRRTRAASMDDRAVMGSVTLAGNAQNALDRLQLDDNARARIGEVLKPGTALIVSDEAPSPETSPFTDLIVQPR